MSSASCEGRGTVATMGTREGEPLASVDREDAVAEGTPFQLGNFAIDDPRPMKGQGLLMTSLTSS